MLEKENRSLEMPFNELDNHFLRYLLYKIRPQGDVHTLSLKEVQNDIGRNIDDKEIRDMIRSVCRPLEVVDGDSVKTYVPFTQICCHGRGKDKEITFTASPFFREFLSSQSPPAIIPQTLFKSVKTLNLYELIISNKMAGKTISLGSLHDYLNLPRDGSYVRWANLNQRVLKSAIQEINDRTPYNVAMEPQKEGRQVTAVVFHVETKKTTDYEQPKSVVQAMRQWFYKTFFAR